MANNNLGVALKELGRLRGSGCVVPPGTWKLKPEYAEAHSNLAIVLKGRGSLEEALACWRRALELNQDAAELQSNLGVALKEVGASGRSWACWRKALELKPEFAEAYGNLGSVSRGNGAICQAQEEEYRALKLNPGFALAHFQLAELLGDRLPEEDMAALHHALEEADLTDAQRLLLHFGLALVLDAPGQYAEAAEHLDKAHALQKRLNGASEARNTTAHEQAEFVGSAPSEHVAIRRFSNEFAALAR